MFWQIRKYRVIVVEKNGDGQDLFYHDVMPGTLFIYKSQDTNKYEVREKIKWQKSVKLFEHKEYVDAKVYVINKLIEKK